MISSSNELTDHRENANDLTDMHNSPQVCMMCVKKEESKAYCTTCNLHLCLECELAHKRMLCFQTHCTVPVNNPQSSDDLKLESNEETSCNEYIHAKRELKAQFLEGEKQLQYMMKLSQELEKSLEDLHRDHMVSVDYVNDMFQQFYKLLKEERDDLIVSIDEQHNIKQTHLLVHKEEIDGLIRSLSFKLSNFALLFEDERESFGDLQNGNFFASNSINGYSSCTSSLMIEENGVKITDSDDTASSSVSLNGNLLPFQGTFDSNYVVSNELPSLPRVSTPRELGLCVIPNHALTSSNPDSLLPIKSQVNSMHICKTFGQKGSASAQFNSPHGFCLGSNEDVVVADSSNHRIQIFDKAGRFKMQFGVAGRHDGRLWHPRKIAYLPIQRRYVVCDRGYERSRMQIFSEDGKFLKKIYIQFIDIVAGIAVNENGDIIVVDSVTPTVFIIGYNEFLRSIDCSEFMVEPSDIVSKGKELYICDFKGHCIVVINEDGELLRKFGKQQITFPNGLDITMSGNVVVGDSHGNFFHVVVFSTDGQFIAEFRCPYVKVSRCCGLKVSSQGRLITVDKNYHHVIVLEPLQIALNTSSLEYTTDIA